MRRRMRRSACLRIIRDGGGVTLHSSAERWGGVGQGGGAVIPNDKEIPEPHYSFVPQHCTHLVPVLALLGWVHDDRKS